MQNVYIVSAKRTPIGRFQGGLKSLSAPRLGAVVAKAVLENIKPELVDEVIFGNVLTAGVGQAPARQTSIYAGIPESAAALTVGKVCGSGLQAVILASQRIALGEADFVVAGGQESMSQAPYLIPGARDGLRLGNKELTDSLVNDGLWDPYNLLHMGNCAELCVKEFKFTRKMQDDFAIESYRRAREALDTGEFKNEIVPVNITSGKVTSQLSQDEEPMAADLSKIESLKPAFEKDGTITPGNASKINDGAAALLLCSEASLKAHGLKPMARIVSSAVHAQDPKWFTTAPVAAIQKALSKAKLEVKDIDLFEINEAFACVTMAAMEKLSIPHQKVNIHGGACALGHPIGASGARILTTLLHALVKKNQKFGVASLCIGGGEGIALVIERI